MTRIKAAELVLDFSLYPRHDINEANVRSMVQSLSAGKKLPPVLVDRRSRRVVDGFHRTRAVLKCLGSDADIDAEFKDFANDSAMFEEAMRRNASHGLRLYPYDIAHCVVRGREFGLADEVIADAVSITHESLRHVVATKISVANERLLPIKRTLSHLAGQELTTGQQRANEHAGGHAPLFYVNQVILLLENEAWDREDDQFSSRLLALGRLIDEKLAVPA